MRYSNAINTPGSGEPQYYPLTYVHADGQRTEFDLQQVRYEDGRLPCYVLSESPRNQGPGFEHQGTRDAVSAQGAEAAMLLNWPDLFPEAEKKIRPNQINLFQQTPDGSFQRVEFREIGQDGRPNTNVEMQQNDPELYDSLKQKGEVDNHLGEMSKMPAFTEAGRTLYAREEVEATIDAPLHAPRETLQQQQESLKAQWQDLSGPSIDRVAEQQANQRSQEQNQQVNDHQQKHERSHEY